MHDGNSLFRFQGDISEGLALFNRFAEIFHPLTQILETTSKVKVERAWLERLASLCRRHPTWTIAHFAASLDFKEALNHPAILM